jgi:DNA invertase Pin-like site-specific DNA recombinase
VGDSQVAADGDAETLIEEMTRLGERRTAADQERLAAGAELRKLVRRAHAQGIPAAQIVKASGLSRQAVYNEKLVREGDAGL